jgi:putative lipoic acid-binding regulatory protein
VSELQKVAYPAVFHFRVVVEPGALALDELAVVLAGRKVTEPLAASRASAGGRYLAYSVSVEIQSREELDAFDAAVKQVSGVRMVL